MLHLNKKNILEHITNEHKFDNSISIMVLDKSLIHVGKLFLVGMHYLLIVKEGELTLRIANKDHKVTKNSILDIIWVTDIEFISYSKDILFYQLAVSKDFISDKSIFILKQAFTLPYILKLRKDPVLELEAKNINTLSDILDDIILNMNCKDHRFHREVIQYRLLILFMEMCNIVLPVNKGKNKYNIMSRKELLLSDFIKLLSINGYNEHEVGFYAKEMCITPQYLSKVIKEITGLTAYDMICENIVTEAKNKLITSNMTIQAIAYILNFTDQASFGKFFKRHTGLSPLKFKRQ